MIESATLLSYVAVVLGLFLIPGPAVLLVFTRTAQGGRAVGISPGMGIAVGDLLHALAAAVGLSAVLMTSVLAFNVVKWAGVAYLLYLGVQAFRARVEPASERPVAAEPSITPAAAFWQAIPAELLTRRRHCSSCRSCPSSFTRRMVLCLRRSACSAWSSRR